MRNNQLRNMVKFIYVCLFCFSNSAFSELTCSANGTKLFYVNGIFVDNFDAKKTASIIDSRLENVKLDKLKKFDTEAVHNISTGFINDMRETKNMLMANKEGKSREEFYGKMLRSSLGLTALTNTDSAGEKQYQERAERALVETLKRYQINSEEDYRALVNSTSEASDIEIASAQGRLLMAHAGIIKNAAADEFVVNKVVFKIVDSIKNNYKILFIAHSQGNEVLRSAINQIRAYQNDTVPANNYFTSEEYQKFIKITGTLQIAPPSPVPAIYCPSGNIGCNARHIKLKEDKVIGLGNHVMSMFTGSYQTPSIAANYDLHEPSAYPEKVFSIEGVNALINNIYVKSIFVVKTYGIHGMDEMYLSEKFSAIPVEGGTDKPLAQIFRENAISVAETLRSNCNRKCITHQVMTSSSLQADGILFSCGLKTCDEIRFGSKNLATGYFLAPDKKSAMFSVRISPQETPQTRDLEVCFTDDVDIGNVAESFTVVGSNALLESDTDANGNTNWKYLFESWPTLESGSW